MQAHANIRQQSVMVTWLVLLLLLLLLLLLGAQGHAIELTKMKSLPRPWYLQKLICSLPAICACSARAGAATANTRALPLAK
jgi:hypothetical protein